MHAIVEVPTIEASTDCGEAKVLFAAFATCHVSG